MAGGFLIWDRLDEGLPTVAVYAGGGPGTSRRGMFEIPIDVPLSVRVRPGAIVDTIVVSDTTLEGTMIIAPTGKDDHASSWQAATEAPWLTLVAPVGRGRGRFQYHLSGQGLEPGDPSASPRSRYLYGWSRPSPCPRCATCQASACPLGRSLPPTPCLRDSTGPAPTPRCPSSEWLVIEQATGSREEPVVWTRSSRSTSTKTPRSAFDADLSGRVDRSGHP